MVDLSVIIITRNQSWNISRLIESVLNETGSITTELFLVDSASTDRTVEIASGFPVNVIRLRAGSVLTPAAGRYVGYKQLSPESRYVLFLDGDMELRQGWLNQALETLDLQSMIGAVTGYIIDRLPVDTHTPSEGSGCAGGELRELRYCGGAALYRRTAMDNVGTFNPYLYAEEEPDVCLRLRRKGYRVAQLQCAMVNHYTQPNDSFAELLRRRRQKFYMGFGQNLRYCASFGAGFQFALWRGFALMPVLVIAAMLFTLAVALSTGAWGVFGGFSALILAVVFADAIRKRSLYRAGLSVMRRLFSVEGLCRGLMLTPTPPERYPLPVDVVNLNTSLGTRSQFMSNREANLSLVKAGK